MEKKALIFQPYEIEIILGALKLAKIDEWKRCKWEKQEGSQNYWYTPNKQTKRIQFVERSIARQLKDQL